MSYITDIRDIFNTLEPNGTFLFTSEVRADDILRNIDSSDFPIFVIDDNPLSTDTVLTQDASGIDTPKLNGYVLTKYDLLSSEITESNSNRLTQHEQCVVPMKQLCIDVLSQYMRVGTDVLRQNNVKPRITTKDQFNLWSKMLYGVSFSVSNLTLRRVINYCTP